MKAVPEDSFADLYLRARNSESLALFSDSQLARLFRHEGLPRSNAASVAGEVLLRRWLYRGSLPECLIPVYQERLNANLRSEFAKLVSDDRIEELRKNPFPADDDNHSSWIVLQRRIQRFLSADGIIPVVLGRNGVEAIPLPFRFRRHLPKESRVRDLAGRAVHCWCCTLDTLENECNEDLGFVINVVLLSQLRRLEDDSFALPIIVARARTCGRIPEFPPLRLLATGVFKAGLLEKPKGIMPKALLAANMGALFAAPSTGDVKLPIGIQIRDLPAELEARLSPLDIVRLKPRQALRAIRVLEEEVSSGQVTLADAERRLDRYEKACPEECSTSFASEARLHALVLRGAIANHKGNPGEAHNWGEQAKAAAVALKHPRLYVDACAHNVVSLTDLGFLTEAEAAGRELLAWVKVEMQGGAGERTWAEMVASGVLGGQALLHRALSGAACDTESLGFLKRALELAEELEDPPGICRDVVQIAGWHALLSPQASEDAFLDADEALGRFALEVKAVSRAYLLRNRFLGAYRRLLLTQEITEGFEKWELPPSGVGHHSWVYATTLKYRGTLYAARGRTDEAISDFRNSTGILSKQAPPLLRLIGATAAIQAAESLKKRDAHLATELLEEACSIFCNFHNTAGPALSGAVWEERCRGLKNGAALSSLPNPQRSFAC